MKDCQAGCNHFTCGSIAHVKECVNYPESMQEMIDTKDKQIDKMCKMLDGVTTQVSKTSTVHALSCIYIDEFLEKEFKFFTQK